MSRPNTITCDGCGKEVDVAEASDWTTVATQPVGVLQGTVMKGVPVPYFTFDEPPGEAHSKRCHQKVAGAQHDRLVKARKAFRDAYPPAPVEAQA